MTDEPLLIFYSLSHYLLHQPIHLTNMHTEARSPGTAPSGHPIPLLPFFFFAWSATVILSTMEREAESRAGRWMAHIHCLTCKCPN